MNPKDLDKAAKDVRDVVEAAVITALSSYKHKSFIFLRSEEIAKDIAAHAEKCIRNLPERVHIQPHERNQ